MAATIKILVFCFCDNCILRTSAVLVGSRVHAAGSSWPDLAEITTAHTCATLVAARLGIQMTQEPVQVEN